MKGFLFVNILVLAFQASLAADDCPAGFSSNWLFDQKNKKVSLQELYPMDVCHYVRKQLNANVEFRFFKKKELVHQLQLYWSMQTDHDILNEKGKLRPKKEKQNDYKIIKIPLSPKEMDRYEVRDLASGELLGKGTIK